MPAGDAAATGLDRPGAESDVFLTAAATPVSVEIDFLASQEWHRLTDRYADALEEMTRGVPMARHKVRELCEQMHRMSEAIAGTDHPCRRRDPSGFQ